MKKLTEQKSQADLASSNEISFLLFEQILSNKLRKIANS